MVSSATQSIPNNLPNPAPVQQPYQELTASGAITIPAGVVILNLGSAIAAALAAPQADGLELSIISATAQAHTVDLATSGVNGGSADVGTFGGAIGDRVTLISYGGDWYEKENTNVTFA